MITPQLTSIRYHLQMNMVNFRDGIRYSVQSSDNLYDNN
jgi:hypothetical protein